MLKKLNASPVVKYSIIAGAFVVWVFGLTDQIPDVVQTAKYIGISALIVAISAIA